MLGAGGMGEVYRACELRLIDDLGQIVELVITAGKPAYGYRGTKVEVSRKQQHYPSTLPRRLEAFVRAGDLVQ